MGRLSKVLVIDVALFLLTGNPGLATSLDFALIILRVQNDLKDNIGPIVFHVVDDRSVPIPEKQSVTLAALVNVALKFP